MTLPPPNILKKNYHTMCNSKKCIFAKVFKKVICMNRKILILIAVLFPLWGVGGLQAQTTIIDSGSCGANLTWILESDSTLTISGSGAMMDYSYSNYPPWSSYKNSVKIIVIDDNVTTIGDYAFNACINLESIDISNNVTTIGDYAFLNCFNLTSITIPNGVTNVGNNIFIRCDKLISINVDSNNPKYSSNNGILYNKLQDTLILCPVGKIGIVVIPNSVITIKNSAFAECTKLTSVTISNSVTTIGESAFFYCTNLTSIIIGSSVTSIRDDAFGWCMLTSITSYPKIPPVLGKIFGYSLITPVNIPVYIPCGMYNSYNWSLWRYYFTNFIDTIMDTTVYSYTVEKCYTIPYTDDNFTTPIDSAGFYCITLVSSAGCDSVVCLTLTEYPEIPVTYVIVFICQGDSYSFGSEELTEDGIYYDTLTAIFGCDSIIELTLIVNPVYFTQISDSIHMGDTCDFHGKQLTIADIYYDTLQTIFGCDSVIELTLTITNVGVVNYELRNTNYVIYPNPTDGKLIIHNSQFTTFDVEIFDIVGKKIYNQVYEDKIDISSFPSGVYIMKVYDIKKQVSIVKIIKK